MQHRVAATVGGAIIGGLLGSQVQKGKKYDVPATMLGAIAGGLGAREVTEAWDKRRARKEKVDEKWEQAYGEQDRGGRGDKRSDEKGGGRRDERRREDYREDRRDGYGRDEYMRDDYGREDGERRRY
jgi:uncharacterized protein YcfJ